jgi:hypothetical protein
MVAEFSYQLRGLGPGYCACAAVALPRFMASAKADKTARVSAQTCHLAPLPSLIIAAVVIRSPSVIPGRGPHGSPAASMNSECSVAHSAPAMPAPQCQVPHFGHGGILQFTDRSVSAAMAACTDRATAAAIARNILDANSPMRIAQEVCVA